MGDEVERTDGETARNLKESTAAGERSRTINYDLAYFFLSGGRDEVPSCADFVGPVEIRRASSGNYRRGLFATKNLEPGELLLVSNPLAATRQDSSLHVPGKRVPEKLLVELAGAMRKSSLQMSRFDHLASDEIPSMDLFRPASAWSSESPVSGEAGSDLDMDFIRHIVSKKMFHYVELNSATPAQIEVVGLWALPAFANHSCAPNCQHSMVGDTIFLRASRHLVQGEELTISYFSEWFEFVKDRRRTSREWMFNCECERCVFEENVSCRRLSKIYESLEVKRKLRARLLKYAVIHSTLELKNAINKIEAKIASATNEVEAVIKSLGTTVRAKQQGWIRASFMSLYRAGLTGPGQLSIASLRLIVDSMTSVYITPLLLVFAAWLLKKTDRSCSKDSKTYRDTADQVLGIYRVYYGKLPEGLLHNLIQENAKLS